MRMRLASIARTRAALPIPGGGASAMAVVAARTLQMSTGAAIRVRMRFARIPESGALRAVLARGAASIGVVAPVTLQMSTRAASWIGMRMGTAHIIIPATARIPCRIARTTHPRMIPTTAIRMPTRPQPRIGVGMRSACIAVASALLPIAPARAADITMITT